MNEETAKETSEESKKYAKNTSYETSIFKMNVQDEKSVKDMVDYVVEKYGRLDYAVNAAGVSTYHPGVIPRLSSFFPPFAAGFCGPGTNIASLQRSITANTRLSPRRTSKISTVSCTSTLAATSCVCVTK